jgi:acyl carrier protein
MNPKSKDEVRALLLSWIADMLHKSVDALGPLGDDVDLLNDIGLDSLSLAELSSKARHQLGIKVRPGELEDTRLGAIITLVWQRVQATP